MTQRLSKTRFLSGRWCLLKLWYESHAPDLATPPDLITQAIFRTGHEVDRLARSRYPGGHCVDRDHFQRAGGLFAESVTGRRAPMRYKR